MGDTLTLCICRLTRGDLFDSGQLPTPEAISRPYAVKPCSTVDFEVQMKCQVGETRAEATRSFLRIN